MTYRTLEYKLSNIHHRALKNLTFQNCIVSKHLYIYPLASLPYLALFHNPSFGRTLKIHPDVDYTKHNAHKDKMNISPVMD